jgi:TrpR-related protein YerC/YecD
MEPDKILEELCEGILKLETKEEVFNFLKDICTPAEIKALKERFFVAKTLYSTNLSYREIQKQTNASLTTIGRVARFLINEPYAGYKSVLNKLGYQQTKKDQI